MQNELITRPDIPKTAEDEVYRGRILRERKRHKWGDYQAVLTSRALYLYSREHVRLKHITILL